MRSWWILCALLVVTAPARAQQMVEVPNDPTFHPQTPPPPAPSGDPGVPVTQPAPTALQPLPPPIVVAPPLLPPVTVQVERRTNLAVAGGIVLGGAYAINALAAGLWHQWPLAIPIAGPLIEMSGIDPMLGFALGLDFVAQLAGATLVVLGATLKHKVWRPITPVAFAPLGNVRAGGFGLRYEF